MHNIHPWLLASSSFLLYSVPLILCVVLHAALFSFWKEGINKINIQILNNVKCLLQNECPVDEFPWSLPSPELY